MICTKTAYRDLGMIHWLRVKQRKDRKPRKGPMKIPYWCKDCQAYHLRKVAILILSLTILSAVPYETQKNNRDLSEMLRSENAPSQIKGRFDLSMRSMRKQAENRNQTSNWKLGKDETEPTAMGKNVAGMGGQGGKDSKARQVPEVRHKDEVARSSSRLSEQVGSNVAMSTVSREGTFSTYRIKESKHYDPEQGLIPTKFYGRLC